MRPSIFLSALINFFQEVVNLLSDHAKMLFGAIILLVLDLPLAWLIGPATVGLILATRSQATGTDFVFGDICRGLLGIAIGSSITETHVIWMLSNPSLGFGLLIYIILIGSFGFFGFTKFANGIKLLRGSQPSQVV